MTGPQQFVVVTGLSGSGKSLAARCFEDMGFFCVDNLPVDLIVPFHDLVQRGDIHRSALVIDVREGRFLDRFPEVLRQVRERGARVQVLFYDASDDVLMRRFSETRRPHPMSAGGSTLEQAIQEERKALKPIRALADRIIDTSSFTPHQLREFLRNAFGAPTTAKDLNVQVLSFGFKYGLPPEADLVLDVRFLPNPYFVPELKSKDGTMEEIRTFLDSFQEKRTFMEQLKTLLDFLLPRYAAEGKTYLTIALGCTGGKHRSVALAEELGAYLKDQGRDAAVTHRDLGKE